MWPNHAESWADFRNIYWSADVSSPPLLKQISLNMWRKKLQPATLFVVLNIPPLCYEFPNLAMRPILEWTPGRAWRQSEDRELHLKKTSSLFNRIFSIMTCWGPEYLDTNPFEEQICSCCLVESGLHSWEQFSTIHFSTEWHVLISYCQILPLFLSMNRVNQETLNMNGRQIKTSRVKHIDEFYLLYLHDIVYLVIYSVSIWYVWSMM